MVLAPLVLTALGIIFLLQIITIIKINKAIAPLGEKQNKTFQTSAQKSLKKDRYTKESKKERRHPSGSKLEAKKPVSSVDKSLRDINLRLKNAERIQEKARRKMNVGDSTVSGKKSGRDGVIKSNKRRPENSRNFKSNSSSEARKFKPQAPVSSPSSKMEEVSIAPPKASPIPVAESINSSEESFGRDSKISVKRRTLDKLKESISDERPAVADDTKTPEEQKVSFGRR